MFASCNNLFVHPDKVQYSPGLRRDFKVTEDFMLDAQDGPHLHYIEIKPQTHEPQFLVAQFHGNAQNLSSHVHSLLWMVDYPLMLSAFDYRGYGKSEGEASAEGAFEDTKRALEHFSKKAKELNLPLVLIGQSLGGSLLIRALADDPKKYQPHLLVIESSFTSYQKIARQKLADAILTWPFQWMAYLLIDDSLSPDNRDLKQLNHFPTILIYSQNDPVVPFSHGEHFKELLPKGTSLWVYPERAHIAGMFALKEKYRRQLLKELKITP